MRVITGLAKGKKLITVEGNDVVRPTPEKVKEAIFSSIQFDIEGRRVLDLFAGCGQLGIEALSRGAKSAVFVDLSDKSIEVIKKNLENTPFKENAKIQKSDYAAFAARSSETFDIAFLDPPYDACFLENALSLTCNIMSDYGIILCEHPDYIALPESVKDFKVSKKYKFGKIVVTVYRKEVNAL